MSTYTFLPQGFTKRQDPPALGSSHPLIPGRVSERVGRDGLQGVGVLRWEDHTRPLKNGTFLHIVRQTSLRSKVFKVRHRSKLWPSVGVHLLALGLGRQSV